MRDKELYTLIPIDEFKTLHGIDDRDDKLAKFCLVTSSLNLEQYCKRHFLLRIYHETINLFGDLRVTLNEYPAREIIAIFSMSNEQGTMGKEQRKDKREKRKIIKEWGLEGGELIEPEFYRVIPDCNNVEEYPYAIELSPAVLRMGCKKINVAYWAGYEYNKIPSDLFAACYELASWNFNRYKSGRVGMTGNVRGAGVQGEHFEMSMPENVKALIEPYRRKTI